MYSKVSPPAITRFKKKKQSPIYKCAFHTQIRAWHVRPLTHDDDTQKYNDTSSTVSLPTFLSETWKLNAPGESTESREQRVCSQLCWCDVTLLYRTPGLVLGLEGLLHGYQQRVEILASDIFGKQQYLKRVVGHHCSPSFLVRVPLCMHSAGVHRSTFIYNIAPFFIYSLLLYWDPTIGMHTLNFIFLVTTSKRNIVSNVTRQVMNIRTVLYM